MKQGQPDLHYLVYYSEYSIYKSMFTESWTTILIFNDYFHTWTFFQFNYEEKNVNQSKEERQLRGQQLEIKKSTERAMLKLNILHKFMLIHEGARKLAAKSLEWFVAATTPKSEQE